jgi:hypothetical protein
MKDYLVAMINVKTNYLIIISVFIVGLTGFIVSELFNNQLDNNIIRQIVFILALIFDLLFMVFSFRFIIETDKLVNKLDIY